MNIQYAHETVKNDAMKFVDAMYSKESEYLVQYIKTDVVIPCLSSEDMTIVERVRIFTDGSVMGIDHEAIALNLKDWIEEYENHLENANHEAAMRMEHPDYWPGMAGDKG